MPTAKTENYTTAMVARMKEAYTSAGTDITKEGHEARAMVVKQLSDELGKPERSIRSKLVNMPDVQYIKVTAESTVTAGEPEKKEVMAKRVADAFGVEMIDGKECRLNPNSLEKMNKIELGILFHRFNSEIVDEIEEPETDSNENDSQEGETDNE